MTRVERPTLTAFAACTRLGYALCQTRGEADDADGPDAGLKSAASPRCATFRYILS